MLSQAWLLMIHTVLGHVVTRLFEYTEYTTYFIHELKYTVLVHVHNVISELLN